MTGRPRFAAIVIGASAGGFAAITAILSQLSATFSMPVLLAQHLHVSDDARFADDLARRIAMPVIEPVDKEPILPGRVYIAPANYHMLVERTGTIALSVDERVRWSRPSIDVLFESAAWVWTERLIGIILSGANDDGAEGLRVVKAAGGLAIAQHPSSAAYPAMPMAAIAAARVETVLAPDAIGELLCELGGAKSRHVAGSGQREVV